MKKLFSLAWLLAGLLSFISRQAAHAQAPAWQSLTGVTVVSSGGSHVYATTTDSNGNIILVGGFAGAVNFGSTTLTSNSVDAFVAKFNPTSGRFVWAYQMGGGDTDEAVAVAVSGTSIYVTGAFQSAAAAFGSLNLANSSGGGNSFTNAYITKLTDAGGSASFVWVQQPTGVYDEYGTGLAVSGNDVYMTGKVLGASQPPPFPGGPSPCAGVCYNGVRFGTVASFQTRSAGFVAKLTDAGSSASFGWVLPIQEVDGDLRAIDVRAVTVNGSSVYVTGSFSGLNTMSFGSVGLPILGPDAQGFIAKVTDNGNTCSMAWVNRLASSSGEGRAVVANGTAVYVAGSFGGTGAFGTTSLVSTGAKEAFIAKLTDAGPNASFDWAQRAGGTGDDVATALVMRGFNLYAVGYTASAAADFGAATLTQSASQTLFVTKVSSGASGGFLWVQATGGVTGASAEPSSAGVAGSQLYVAGTATPTATFGTLSLASQGGSRNEVLATLADPTLTATTAALRPESIGLFPSPAHGRATVQLPAIPGAATATLTVLDALGRPVRTQMAATNSKAALDLTGLAPGLYAVRVTAGGSTATHKLVVE